MAGGVGARRYAFFSPICLLFERIIRLAHGVRARPAWRYAACLELGHMRQFVAQHTVRARGVGRRVRPSHIDVAPNSERVRLQAVGRHVHRRARMDAHRVERLIQGGFECFSLSRIEWLASVIGNLGEALPESRLASLDGPLHHPLDVGITKNSLQIQRDLLAAQRVGLAEPFSVDWLSRRGDYLA
jgi:hypothetical protein